MNQHDVINRRHAGVIRRGWDTISTAYPSERRVFTDDVHYGPLAPGERQLRLLGDVAGKQILEIGCGGGQNAIALARWGAHCVAIDPSPAQLAHAKWLAHQNGVNVQFCIGLAEDLSAFPDSAFDIALSSYAFDYVTDLTQAYSEVWRILKRGGTFVFYLSHPWFQAGGWYLSDDPETPDAADSAGLPAAEEWERRFEERASAPFRGYLRATRQIISNLIEAGFSLDRLVEQTVDDVADRSPEEMSRYSYPTGCDPTSLEYEIVRKLPLTLIIQACKRESSARSSG